MTEKNVLGKYKLVLGLELHLHVSTQRKMFCLCSTDIMKKGPNTVTCPVCLGLPGALPVPNFEAIRKTQLLGMVFNCKINPDAKFDRKHYFYPDLPKGYQISQYKEPFCLGGYLDLDNGFRVELDRIHLEEDTAKSLHVEDKTMLDFNMSGMPLIEIVTKPVFRNVEYAVEFCKRVQSLVREYGTGDADMEKGQMRLEPNISLRTEIMEAEGKLPPYKVEIKNINSFKFMEKAVFAEIVRQRGMLDLGETPKQENRGYSESKNTTVSQRSKEEAHDYRYFPEPDIPPMRFSKGYFKELQLDFARIKENTPSEQKRRLLDKIRLSDTLKNRIRDTLELSEIKKLIELESEGVDVKVAADLLLNRKEIRDLTTQEILSNLLDNSDKINEVDILQELVKKTIEENISAVENYRKGKAGAIQFLKGVIMRETKGKANAETVERLLQKELG